MSSVSPAPMKSREVELMSVRLHAMTESQCVQWIFRELSRERGGWVVTPNLDHLRRAWKDQAFARLIVDAELRVADGMPLVWAARLRGTPLPERVAGSSLVTTLAEAAAAHGRSIYLLGGAPGAAEGAQKVLQKHFPDLVIAGAYAPAPGFEKDEQQMREIRERLMDADPDLIYVALGSPKQERLITQWRDVVPGAWWVGVGVSLSFLSGQVRRAPKWMQRVGLEWIHRLAQEPGRLARRYLVQDLPFAVLLFQASLLARMRGRTSKEAAVSSQGAGETRRE